MNFGSGFQLPITILGVASFDKAQEMRELVETVGVDEYKFSELGFSVDLRCSDQHISENEILLAQLQIDNQQNRNLILRSHDGQLIESNEEFYLDGFASKSLQGAVIIGLCGGRI